MFQVKCQYCWNKFSINAKQCPSCGVEAHKTIVKIVMANFAVWGRNVLICFIAGYMLWGILDMIIHAQRVSIDHHTTKPSYLDIYAAARTAVRNNLKSPSTARFPSGGEEYLLERSGENQWRVTSYVDAQNSFGAMLRTHYIVDLKYLAEDDWRLIDIKMSQ